MFNMSVLESRTHIQQKIVYLCEQADSTQQCCVTLTSVKEHIRHVSYSQDISKYTLHTDFSALNPM